jgi:hypothetical protein
VPDNNLEPEYITNRAQPKVVLFLKLLALGFTGLLLVHLTISAFEFLEMSQNYAWVMALTGMTYIPYMFIMLVIAADVTLIAVAIHVIAARNAPVRADAPPDENF